MQYDLFGNPIEDKPKKDWSGDTHSVFVTVGASTIARANGKTKTSMLHTRRPANG